MKNVKLLPELKSAPAVFVMKDHYQIMVPTYSDLLFWVTVNGKNYYDHSNGVIRSATRIHRVKVPMEELDKAKEYTVSYRKIIERKPYFSETEEPVSAVYPFQPMKKDGVIRMYHLSDTHGDFESSSKAASYFGDHLDLFILNGDIMEDSRDLDSFDLIYKLCESATAGQRPCIFSRGNHDLRGICAERLAEYIPTDNGNTYFTVRIGNIWAIILDCGEDKDDASDAYGHTICCHEFREEQDTFFENVIKHADTEYNAPGVKYRLVISHNPFANQEGDPFNIEEELYTKWLRMLKEKVKPQVMICGHTHKNEISYIGGNLDQLGQCCPVIVGSEMVYQNDRIVDFVGCALTLNKNELTVVFNNSKQEELLNEVIQLSE